MIRQVLLLAKLPGIFVRGWRADRLLKRRVRQLRGAPADEAFDAIWRDVLSHQRLFEARAERANRFRMPWQNFTLGMIRHHSGQQVWTVSDEDVEAARAMLPEGRGALILTVHNRISFSIMTTLRQLERNPILVRNPERVKKLKTPYISADKDVLINIRRAVKAGQSVLAFNDFTRRRKGTLYQDLYLSTALADFALRAKIDLFLAVPVVTREGKVRVVFEAVSPDPRPTGQEVGQQLIDLMGREAGRRQGWRIIASPKEVPEVTPQLFDLALMPPEATGAADAPLK